MELVKFRVEGKEYKLKELPTEREIESLKNTYMQVADRLKNATDEEKNMFKWESMLEHLAISGAILTKCFGFSKNELDKMEHDVSMKLFWALVLYLFTGKVKNYL